MSVARLAWALRAVWVVIGTGPAAVQSPAVPLAAPSVAQQEPARDFTREIGAGQLAAELLALAEEQQELVSVESIGKSRAGHDILVVTLGSRREGDPDRRPALFVTADLEQRAALAPAGAQAGLFLLHELVARAHAEPAVAELLARTSVYVIPAPAPDVLDELAAAEPSAASGEIVAAALRTGALARGARDAVDLNQNFPVGWQPFRQPVGDPAAVPSRQGPYPLCEPESLALARFLLERSNVAGAVLASRRPLRGREGAREGSARTDPAADGAHVDASASETAVATAMATTGDIVRRLGLPDELARAIVGRAQDAEAPGSLPAFCHGRLASPTFLAPAWEGLPVRGASGDAPAGFAATADLVLALLAELPHLAAGEPRVERLRPDLWQVNVALAAGGALCRTPRGPRPIEGLELEVVGGEVELVAQRRGDEHAFRALDAAGGVAALGTLEGGVGAMLRVVVRAPAGSRLELALRSRSAGGASVLALLE